MFFTAADLGSILNIPSSGSFPFTLKGAINFPYSVIEQLQIVMNNPTLTNVVNPKTVDVCPLACVLHKIVRYNLLPRLGGGADFTFQDLVVVAMIMKGQSFNFAQMMFHHMVSCIHQTKKFIPYGALLTKVFQHFHISFDNEVSLSVSESFDSALLKQSKISLVDGIFVRLSSDVPPLSPSHPP